eukprot:CAMPEP_0203806892 /NCGR_PEP_ID=MMETSP0115-20131106/764_1 /ASSEMBLY_ACC=CAM_ASM_000227 /TAXON_ID=33651 /ORGANISM="Bicosoecid sp, Strain ms1" /LENGTH=118 /DNA_ID=CAMNT_0050715559 /DNA_START=191 /DNA_END=544 /DNA_ORIENTATION=+
MADDAAGIVDRVKAYFYEDDTFEETFLAWAKEHSDVISKDEEEMKLEYTALHESFLAFFEERMEKFIADAGSTPSEFYKAIKKAVLDDPSGEDNSFIQIVLAAVEFSTFMQMMREARA